MDNWSCLTSSQNVGLSVLTPANNVGHLAVRSQIITECMVLNCVLESIVKVESTKPKKVHELTGLGNN